MLNDTYVEQSVKAKPGAGYYLKMILAIVLIVVGIPLIALYGAGLFLIAAGIVILIYYAGDARLEYEYTLTNGGVDIAAIYNARRRKEKLQFDLENVTMIVPKDSNRINPQEKYKTYSFLSKAGEGQQIALIMDLKGNKTMVLMEPNEKSMEHIKTFAKNKCYDI